MYQVLDIILVIHSIMNNIFSFKNIIFTGLAGSAPTKGGHSVPKSWGSDNLGVQKNNIITYIPNIKGILKRTSKGIRFIVDR